MEEVKAPSPSGETASQPPSLSPGMATLLSGGNGADKPSSSAAPAAQEPLPPAPLRGKRLLQTSLFLADLLLLGLTMWLIFKTQGPFGFIGTALCVVAVILGAWLSCLALWLDR